MSVGPRLSVIMPVRNGEAVLPQSLAALAASDLPRDQWEMVLVDDGSTDGTIELARQYADRVIRLTGRAHGPSYARNRGVEAADGELLIFVDADVCVHSPTLRLFLEALAADPDVSAVFGSYDDDPPAPGFVSRYRNLLHHYVHQQNPGEAQTFWAGCGAIRRSVFLRIGMYNEWHFSRPQVEDIELGQRLRDAGFRILLRPDIQATHLKRWGLWGMITTDLLDRGVPWMRLLIRRGATTKEKSLNLRNGEKIKTGLLALAFASLLVAALRGDPLLAGLSLALVLPVIIANWRLYRFFARKAGIVFAAVTIPLNLLYYGINTVAVAVGWAMHLLVGDPQPPVDVEAMAELGIDSWPPVPRKLSETPDRTNLADAPAVQPPPSP